MTPDEHSTADARLVRRLARERQSRREAESIAERATRDLYDTVQALTHANRLAELLGDIAVCANEAATVDKAIQFALDAVLSFTGWKVGHALVLSEQEPGTLVSLRVWSVAEEESCLRFRALSEELAFGPGIGLPGRVLTLGEPSWIVDLSVDRDFPRADAALECGLVSAFALPLLIRSETVGVIEFFATDMHPPDDTILRVAGFVGAQLGRVLERRAAEDRLRQLALFDALTGLPNRSLLMERLEATVRRCQEQGTPVDVLYLDIDDFKTINDSRGHSTGDEVLIAVGRSLLTASAESTRTVARLAGDEFVVVLEDCTDATLAAREIEAALRHPLPLSEGEAFVTVSGGLASAHPYQPDSAEQVLSRANLALHEAKRTGKGRIVSFEAPMQDQALQRHALGAQLHRAVLRQEFTLVYQPVVRLEDDRIIGAEALIRWQHPDLGLVMPDTFIARAEETGLIVPIGAWVLAEACRQGQEWAQSYGDFSMAVNVSGRQLREADFPDTVGGALRISGLAPHQLILEMTESILMERDALGIAMLTRLRDLGIHLAIDDFGTGYSSLGSLRQLPADMLKIDRSFVSALPDDGDAGTIAWAIVRLGHTLDMAVLAEGVETLEQRDALRAFGCDQVQGYLFSRPVSAEAMTELLHSR